MIDRIIKFCGIIIMNAIIIYAQNRFAGWGNNEVTDSCNLFVIYSLLLAAMSLSVNDLKVLYPALYPARTKWYDIGLLLNVPVDKLDTIKSENKDNLGACLREMLHYALKSGDRKLTWKRVVDALKNDIVGDAELADSLSRNYRCNEGTCIILL